MIEWIVIGGLVIAMYIILNRYEKRMERMQKIIDAHEEKIDKNKSKIKTHHEKIDKNKDRLDDHYNHIEKLWVAAPKHKHESKSKD